MVPDPTGGRLLNRRGFLGATAGVSLAALGASPAAAENGDTVTLVHDTHFHGRFESASDPELNIARYYGKVLEFLDARENSLFLGNGDDLAPSILGLEYEGEHMVDALNYMRPDAVGAGNHEFDFGVDVATRRFEESEFPWVVANLLTPEGDPVPGTERWITVERGEHTVGVFGLGSGGFHSLTDYPDDWQVLDIVDAAREAVAALREEGADVVVLASHVSSDAHRRLAREVDGLDAIVGSHSGVVFEEPEVVSGTVISEFGDEFNHLGWLALDAETGDLVDWERFDFVDDAGNVRTDVPEDSGLRELADEWLDDIRERLGRPYFSTEVELDATFDTNYARESRWGNLMTDVMREVGDVDVDVAVQNAGGIRSNSVYGPGEITGLQLLDILPFPNEIEVLEVTGEQLVAFLESQVRPLTDGSRFGAQPAVQVSGVQYEWRGHGGDSEVLEAFVGGEPVDSDESYLFASNDYVVGNSDALADAEHVLHTGQLLGPYVLEKLAGRGTVAPELEHRMIRVDEDVGAHTDVFHRRGESTLVFDAPETATALVEGSFRLVDREGDDLTAVGATVEGDDLRVSFETDELRRFVRGDEDRSLRVFGGFDPDEAAYGYVDDDGELLELPVSAGYDRFELKGSVDADDPSLRP